MTNIYLDIETIPVQNPETIAQIKEGVKAPSNYKDPEKIAAYITENLDGEVLKTSFDGTYGHIICIGVAVEDNDPVTFYAETVDHEKDILNALNDFLANNGHASGFTDNKVFIGHNIQGFDLPMIKKRSMILGIKPYALIPFNTKPWDLNPYDTMMQWDAKNYSGLGKLLTAFGIGTKGDVDGSMVYEMWKAGKHQEIQDYCASDVSKVRQLYKRMTYAA